MMTYTGTLIEDLMAMVERAEQRARSRQAFPANAMLLPPMLPESWIPSVEPNPNYDSKPIGVA